MIEVIGGGLAGSEAAYQLLALGHKVRLHEMRPKAMTPAHKTGRLAELVCSNSLKSMGENTAPGILKREMQAMDSLIIRAAMQAKVPAGDALAVDRELFSRTIEQELSRFPDFELVCDEVTEIPLPKPGCAVVIATGPLTTEALSMALAQHGPKHLHFYDAIAPVIDGDSIDMASCFLANRYDESGDGDYLNLPLDKESYETLMTEIERADKVALHEFEKTPYFESCLPIEVMVERGRETLRFGPMKPVGLTDPKTGRWPYAAVQLRRENKDGSMWSMVGFQTKMTYPEQKRIFRMLPGLHDAEFYRLGSVHRNTYVNGPEVLEDNLSLKALPHVFLAGQVTGVEGYTESSAIGLLAGRAVDAYVKGQSWQAPQPTTMIGALHHYVTRGTSGPYQPMNANFGLIEKPEMPGRIGKKEKKQLTAENAARAMNAYLGKGASTGPVNRDIVLGLNHGL